MKNRILLVEDEKNFGAVLKDYLSLNDFSVTLCEDGVAGLQAFMNGEFDLCIVDVMMPKKDGFSLVNEIKELNKTIPVVFLTARAMRDDVLKGYKTGADDYIIKPFDTEVLLYKIKVILNRGNPSVPIVNTLHTIGNMRFDSKLRTLVYPDAREVKLSPKESELLHLLCQYKNDVLPRDKALKQIWKDDTYFTGRSMDVYIVKLRKYLQHDSNIEILNLHGNGYRLVEKSENKNT